MRHHRHVAFGTGTGLVVTLLATLFLGATPASSAQWRQCPDVEYWERVQAKGVSCATAYRVRERAMEKVPGGVPVNWKGRVGSWTCSYKNV